MFTGSALQRSYLNLSKSTILTDISLICGRLARHTEMLKPARAEQLQPRGRALQRDTKTTRSSFTRAVLGISVCYGRPLLQAWLLPDLNTIPSNCVREDSLSLSGYGIGFWGTRYLVRILSRPYISASHLFLCYGFCS